MYDAEVLVCSYKKCHVRSQRFSLRLDTPKLRLRLVNKLFAAETRCFKSRTHFISACSTSCLDEGLKKLDECFRYATIAVVVTQKYRFPVALCEFNKSMLFELAATWQKELLQRCCDSLEEWWPRVDFCDSGSGWPSASIQESTVFLRAWLVVSLFFEESESP